MHAQDDLSGLHHLRAALSGDPARLAQSAQALAEDPGRAAGRQAAWSFRRSADRLCRYGRRPIEASTGCAPSADERRVLRLMAAIAHDDHEAARAEAQFLVRRDAVDGLIEALTPGALAVYGQAHRLARRRAA